MSKQTKRKSNTGKVVLVTGASQGIGLATSEFLALSGYRVYAGIRASSNLEKLKIAQQKCPDLLTPVFCDVTDEMSIQKAVNLIIEESGTIDILVNNACHVYWGTHEVCTLKEQQDSMNVNYFGIIRMLQNVLPIMRSQRNGHIINMSSVSGFEAYPSIETYVATKFAVEGLSESIAIYLSEWNIHVSLVEPGAVKTDVAFHSTVGSRKVMGTPLLNQYSKDIYQLAKQSYEKAQNSVEIAKLIKTICESSQPQFRYQTSESVQKRAALRFIDPSGDSLLREKRQLLTDRDLKVMFNK